MPIVTADASLDHVPGDATGLAIPTHGAALLAGGTDWLTMAFRAFGALSSDNRVTAITRFDPCPGGSTGRKYLLSVAYARPQAGLHDDLFVKFSRDFDDPRRDHARWELEAEVRFAAISRLPGFPITVPVAAFADYQHVSGSGLLITERIGFGTGGIEPHHPKCLDHAIDDPVGHYRAIIKALARLAAAHRSGRLTPDIAARFPFDPIAAAARDPIRHDAAKLREQVARYADFAARYPQLLPANIRSAAFIETLDREVGRFVAHEAAIKRFLQGDPDLIALCHWNANIDNGWYWRDPDGEWQCGLMDWGHVGQMNMAFALWGCLSGADFAVWDRHLGDLLRLFVGELQAQGGPRLDIAELALHLDLHVATMGLAYLLATLPRIAARLPAIAHASGPHDPIFRDDEAARAQLHMTTAFLNLWQTRDLGASLDRLLARVGG